VLRQALFARAFNPSTRQLDLPPEIAAALGWAARASLPGWAAGVLERVSPGNVRPA
jgi:hypothetical protein